MQIKTASTLQAARQAAADAETLLAVAGSYRFISSEEQKNKLVEETIKFYLIDRLREPLEQYV